MCLGVGASKGAGDGSQKKPCKSDSEDEEDGQVRQRGQPKMGSGVFVNYPYPGISKIW